MAGSDAQPMIDLTAMPPTECGECYRPMSGCAYGIRGEVAGGPEPPRYVPARDLLCTDCYEKTKLVHWAAGAKGDARCGECTRPITYGERVGFRGVYLGDPIPQGPVPAHDLLCDRCTDRMLKLCQN